MTFTVTYKHSAEQELARLWTIADDRAAVTRAANAIDALLRTNPQNQGESREDGTRVLFDSPLGVRFEVNDQDRIVEVLNIWSY